MDILEYKFDRLLGFGTTPRNGVCTNVGRRGVFSSCAATGCPSRCFPRTFTRPSDPEVGTADDGVRDVHVEVAVGPRGRWLARVARGQDAVHPEGPGPAPQPAPGHQVP